MDQIPYHARKKAHTNQVVNKDFSSWEMSPMSLRKKRIVRKMSH